MADGSRDDEAPTRGHKKKARTRRLLLDTASEVVADRGEAFTISDLAAAACVSQGTFYNYFSDRDALLDALVHDVIDAFTAERAASTAAEDPAVRFAVITAEALDRAADSPELTRAALRLESIQRALLDGGGFEHLRDDLEAGHRAGRFSAPPDDATVDVVISSILVAGRRIVDGRDGTGYRTAVVTRLLVSLGLDEVEAGTIADDACHPTRATPT